VSADKDVDEAIPPEVIQSANADAPGVVPPPDLSRNVVATANLTRDPSKGISMSVPNDFQPGDLQAIMEMTLQLLNAAFVARMNPLQKAGLLVPDRKLTRIT